MTSLDPTHFPGLERTSDRTTGQVVKTSVTSPGFAGEFHPTSSETDSSATPSWRGAWKRRQEAKLAQRRSRHDAGGSDSEHDAADDGKIPIPPIPDLRYEQGILSSIRPFLHSTMTAGGGEQCETKRHEEKQETVEKVVLASSQLTATDDAKSRPSASQSEALMGPLRIEWGMVTYVLIRDQVVFPLLQGVLWGMAGIYLNGLWQWNRERLALKNSSQLAQQARRSRPASGSSLLARLGLRT
ncbi:hypothetical protein JCM3766R1_004748 [Sporobolomyces carnicolor]